MALHRESHALNRLIWGKYKKIFLSKTTRLRALIFGLWHNLLDLYQDCSNYAPVAKNNTSWVTCFPKACVGKSLKHLV